MYAFYQFIFFGGLWLLIGIKKTMEFMARPSSRCGSIFLAIGFIVIFERYVFIGSLLQIYGIFYSFRDFLSKIAYWLNDLPIIGILLRRKNHVLP